MTAVATWMAVAQIGAMPVGVDIDAERRCMDPAKARGALGPRTRAIVAVHLFGQPADVDGLSELRARPGCRWSRTPRRLTARRSAGAAVGSLGGVRRVQLLSRRRTSARSATPAR